MAEQLIYEDGKIRITTHVFSNGRGDQFVIGGIKDISEVHTSKPFWALILGLVLIGLASWREFFVYSREIMGGLGAVSLLWYFTSKEIHRIRMITPMGEVEAFSTKDEIQFKNVLSCLKKAWVLLK